MLQVFGASRSRRGDKGRDDRKFLEALHYFAVHNITWRALPAEFGTLEQRVEAVLAIEPVGHLRGLLRGAGGHERDGASGADVQFHRRARPCLGGRRKRGQEDQALGRSRGGFSTKIHLKTDSRRPAARLPSDRRRSQRQSQLRDAPRHRSRHHAARRDRRQGLRCQGKSRSVRADAASVRSSRTSQTQPTEPAFFPKILYKARARIEQAVGKLKRFKRIALRCEKTARNYASFVALALGFILIKSVHTA